MITVRKSADRGYADHGWLKTHHSFSFAGYFDPEHMGVRALRVLNDDRIAPGAGFPTHPHRDMEIVSYVVEGALEHRDSMGNGSVIRAGEFQRMSAGTGVTHSEFNPSPDEETRLLQIWILPDRNGREPEFEQRLFDPEERRGRLRLVASPDGRDGSLTIHQDVTLHSGILAEGESAEHRLNAGRHAWVQVVSGTVEIGGAVSLGAGDGASVSDETALLLRGGAGGGELLLFDLA